MPWRATMRLGGASEMARSFLSVLRNSLQRRRHRLAKPHPLEPFELAQVAYFRAGILTKFCILRLMTEFVL